MMVTGYKLRTTLAQQLQRRCKAIRRAVSEYNTTAKSLSPPRPPLEWDTVTKYNFLEEFHLLHDTRNDIRDKRRTQPAIREAMKLRNRIARAREELIRCAVELRRLQTAIRDEEGLFNKVLGEIDASKDPMYGAVLEFAQRRMGVNDYLLSRIHEAHALEDFQCIKEPGVWLGSGLVEEDAMEGTEQRGSFTGAPIPLRRAKGLDQIDSDSDVEESGGGENGEEDLQDEHLNMVDYIATAA